MTLLTVKGNEHHLKLLEGAIATVRNISYLLHPPLLDETGLHAALHWYVEGLVKRSNIQISLSVNSAAFPRFAPEIETTIFRIIQESLTNVYRYSQSENASVEVVKKTDVVVVRVGGSKKFR